MNVQVCSVEFTIYWHKGNFSESWVHATFKFSKQPRVTFSRQEHTFYINYTTAKIPCIIHTQPIPLLTKRQCYLLLVPSYPNWASKQNTKALFGQPFGKAGLPFANPLPPHSNVGKIKHSYCNMSTHCLPDFIRVHVTIQLHLACSKSTEEILSDTYP